MTDPPLTTNAIAYAWERLWDVAGAEKLNLPRIYGSASSSLTEPGVIVVPAPANAWTDLLNSPPHSLDWLPAEALFPPGYPRPFDDRLPILFWSDADRTKPPIWVREDGTVIFHIDLIAATLFMLTRWEEIVRPERDEHARFPASASTAFRQGFLDQPIVDRYAMILRAWLQKLRPNWKPRVRSFRLRLSHDIDHLQRFETASLALRQAARDLLRSGSPAAALNDVYDFLYGRWRFSRNPFLTALEMFARQAESLGARAVFYVLAGASTPFDPGYDPTNPTFVQRLQRLRSAGHVIGLHPSYAAFLDENRYRAEKKRLETILQHDVHHARQHYLRFRAPDTWRIAQRAGVSEDATLGYPDHEGFRCGASHPFPVFDIQADQRLSLIEHPLHIMDGTLKEYRRLTPDESRRRMELLARRVAEVEGELHLLWHNHAVTGAWSPWFEAYSRFLSEIVL
ncbi:MAG: hypothetical protein GXP42_15385 [Chloroflexi bacterium]|nr:hypothetical protein [Chloroflexota bacterium]